MVRSPFRGWSAIEWRNISQARRPSAEAVPGFGTPITSPPPRPVPPFPPPAAGAAAGLVREEQGIGDGASSPYVIDDAAPRAETAVATEEAAGAPVAPGPARGLVEEEQA